MFCFSESIEALHQRAREDRELDDFGADDYREALERLCRSLDEDAKLTPIGEMALQQMIVDALSARLMCEAGWQRFPEAREARVERPLVIVGLPRTGTTALHHLIGQDPGFQALEHWLLRTPKPRPPRDDWAADPDFQAAAARVDMMFARSPEMRAIHEIEAHLPDECWNLFAQNFLHSSYEANADVAGYASWWASVDLTPVDRRHLRYVQLIGHREPERRWVFKDATHLFDARALFEVYPDALVVQTHRDPVRLIPSVCSLCWSAREALNTGTDAHVFGRSTLALWERSIFSMMEARATQSPDRFYDLHFDRFIADPLAAIRDVYSTFDIPWTEAAETAMKRFRHAHPRGQHGAHRYHLEQWGLDADEIAERFRPYTEAYGVAPERASD